jgi:hypothetical protein
MSGGTAEHKKTKKEERSESNEGQISNVLENAENLLTDDLQKQKTYRGRLSNLLSRFTPGGYIPTKEQAEVNALGDVLRGNLFNIWGYRNRAEFEHVPSISADNPPEVNLQIIQTLKKLMGEAENEQLQGQQNPKQETPAQNPTAYTADESSIPLYNPKTDEETEVHPDDVAAMEQLGWQRV